jgi:uncharacterized protein (DUF1499 family)
MMPMVVLLILMACAAPELEQETSGFKGLAPCPDSPNCVSSLSRRSAGWIAPLEYDGERKDASDLLKRIIESHKRARIVHRSSDFLRAEYASLIFGFVDDVEFWFPADHPVIHIRSASRTGSYDFGVNRRRIERIRAQFEKHAGKHDGLGGGIRSDV